MIVYSQSLYFIKSKVFLLFTVFFLSIISALRIFGIDRDYKSYLRFYNKISLGDFGSRFEPGFELISSLFKIISGNDSFTLFLFFIAFIGLYLKFSIILDKKYYPLLILVYFFLIFPLHEMTQIRVGLAVSVMYWTLNKSIVSNINIIKKSLLIIIGISFHSSSIIIVPFILFPKLVRGKLKLRKVLMIIVPILLLSNSINAIIYFSPFVEFYLYEIGLQETLSINPLSSRNIIFIAILIIGFFNYNKIPSKDLPWYYLSIIGLGLWYSFMWLPVFAHRFLEITIFAYLVWIPSLPKNPRFVSMGLLLVLSSYFFIKLVFLDMYFL
tara:strand:- start:91 stop:1068 length:978 start_codon:yes stop_codon:yes gene_type:complete